MPKPVIALVGSDAFLQSEKLGEILETMGKGVNRIDFDGERAQLAEIFDELRSFTMFGGAKLVVITAADELLKRFREQLETYVAAPSDSATLVLRLNALPGTQRIHKLITKHGEIIACAPPGARELPEWIVTRAKKAHRVTIAPDAARTLAELIGADMGRLDSELAKLTLQGDGKAIDAKAVSGNVVFQREQEMWEMTNALAAGQPAEAIRRWRQLIQGDSSTEFRAVTWLTMWLEDVRAVVSKEDTGKLSWRYKDRFPQFLQSARAMGEAGLRRAVDLLTEIDKQSKSGIGDAAANVERFIITMTNMT